MRFMKILVDADACPKEALAICFRLGGKYNIAVWTVASLNHNIKSENHVIVGPDPQAADIKIINMTTPGDIIVTQDWGLASMVLGKKAYSLSPTGRKFTDETIDFLLEEREVKARFRRGGGRTKGPHRRTDGDDRRFAAALEELVLLGKSVGY
jgi:uncharacterized protein YaiI (UPF0178 family)